MERDDLGNAVVEVILELLSDSGQSMRALHRASGIKLTRLHSILSQGSPIYVDEIDMIAGCFGSKASLIVEEAEGRLADRDAAEVVEFPRVVSDVEVQFSVDQVAAAKHRYGPTDQLEGEGDL